MVHIDDEDDEYWQEYDKIIQAAAHEVAVIATQAFEKFPCRTSSLTGYTYLRELLLGNPRRIKEVL